VSILVHNWTLILSSSEDNVRLTSAAYNDPSFCSSGGFALHALLRKAKRISEAIQAFGDLPRPDSFGQHEHHR